MAKQIPKNKKKSCFLSFSDKKKVEKIRQKKKTKHWDTKLLKKN
jgi:hypothetical protein